MEDYKYIKYAYEWDNKERKKQFFFIIGVWSFFKSMVPVYMVIKGEIKISTILWAQTLIKGNE